MSDSVMRNTEEVLRVLSQDEVLDTRTLITIRRMLELDDSRQVRQPICPEARGKPQRIQGRRKA